jgi:hypothetical protein
VPERLRKDNNAMQSLVMAVANMRQSWHEFRRRRWLWSVTVLSGVSVLVVYAPIMALGPVVARQWLGGVSAWAAILAAMGIGGIVAGGIVAWMHPAKPMAWVVWGSILWLPVLPLLAFHVPVWSIAAAAALFGFDNALYWTFWGTTVQQRVPKDVLARVNSFDSLGIYGPSPVAYFLIGPSCRSPRSQRDTPRRRRHPHRGHGRSWTGARSQNLHRSRPRTIHAPGASLSEGPNAS